MLKCSICLQACVLQFNIAFENMFWCLCRLTLLDTDETTRPGGPHADRCDLPTDLSLMTRVRSSAGLRVLNIPL